MREPAWRQQGTEPDYRFTLANERTFLAWVRTALSLLAGGILVVQFADRLAPGGVLVALAVALAALAAAFAALAYRRWKGNEIEMRHGRPLPASIAVPLLAWGAVVVAAAVAALLLIGP